MSLIRALKAKPLKLNGKNVFHINPLKDQSHLREWEDLFNTLCELIGEKLANEVVIWPVFFLSCTSHANPLHKSFYLLLLSMVTVILDIYLATSYVYMKL